MITLEQVNKDYGPVRAVNNLSLEIQSGEITGLLGPNGAGKTTTMRMITGYFGPSSGRILVDGTDVAQNPERVKSIIGYLPESPPLYGEMMVLDYLTYIAGVRRIDNRDRIFQTAETCGITAVLHKKIEELSKGYKQRVGLAQALIHDPKILILDEPTSGLDPNQIAEVRALIKEIGKTKTIILSTHILQEVEAIAERVIIINKGEIVEDNTTSALQAVRNGNANIRLALRGPEAEEACAAFEAFDGVVNAQPAKGEEGLVTLNLKVAAAEDLRPKLFESIKKRDWTLYEMSREKHSLEEIFRDLTREGGRHE